MLNTTMHPDGISRRRHASWQLALCTPVVNVHVSFPAMNRSCSCDSLGAASRCWQALCGVRSPASALASAAVRVSQSPRPARLLTRSTRRRSDLVPCVRRLHCKGIARFVIAAHMQQLCLPSLSPHAPAFSHQGLRTGFVLTHGHHCDLSMRRPGSGNFTSQAMSWHELRIIAGARQRQRYARVFSLMCSHARGCRAGDRIRLHSAGRVRAGGPHQDFPRARHPPAGLIHGAPEQWCAMSRAP